MDTSPVDAIKERLSIEDVVSGYIKLERAGKYLRARCPFHAEKTPSFTVTPDRGWWHCFGCNRGGDIFSFVQEIEHTDFKEALSILAQKAGVTLAPVSGNVARTKVFYDIMEYATKFYEVQFRTTKDPVVPYLSDRGITKETMISFRIGWAPDAWDGLLQALRKKGFKDRDIDTVGLVTKGTRGTFDRFRGRIMFPIMDNQGRVIAFSGRILPGVGTPEKQGGKYVNSPETPLYHKSKVLFGYHLAKDAMVKKGRALLVEGQMDLLLAHQMGTKEAVALSGTACTENHIRMIGRFTDTIVLALDRDKAGLDASERVVELAYADGMTVYALELPRGSDPADIIRASPEQWKETSESPIEYLRFRTGLLRDVSGKQKITMIHKELFPLVKRYKTELERDEALKSISHAGDVSLEALRSDFARFSGNNPSAQTLVNIPVTEGTKLRSKKQVLLDQLMTLGELLVDTDHLHTLVEWFDSHGGNGAYEEQKKRYLKRIPGLVSSANIMYADATIDDLARVLQEVIKRYEIILAEEHVHRLLHELAESERRGDKEKEGQVLRAIKDANVTLEKAKQVLQD